MLGYAMRLIKTPGKGYHYTLTVLYDKTGQILTALPQDAAQALDLTFVRQPNPYQIP